MESKNFIKALGEFEESKKISSDVLIDALKAALINAFQRKNGKECLARVDVNAKKGTIEMYQQKNIVEEVVNPLCEISLHDAQEINHDYKVGDVFETPISIDNFDRMSAIHVKQMLKQKITETEKQMVYDAYINKKDDIIFGVVDRVEKGGVIINIGNTFALMRTSQMIPGEEYRPGESLKIYITNVDKDSKGAQVLVSRTDPNFLKRLFEEEITEIYDGTVEIRAIAREPGERSKVAVSTHDDNIDATGACIGMKGMRIQKITSQIANEKIDVIQYFDEPELYIADSLKPAHVYGIIVNKDSKQAIAVVPNEELSLAIGKKGQNVRLAARLTGWKIDIKTVDTAMQEHLTFKTLADYRAAYDAIHAPATPEKSDDNEPNIIIEHLPEPEPRVEPIKVEVKPEVIQEPVAPTPEPAVVEPIKEEIKEEVPPTPITVTPMPHVDVVEKKEEVKKPVSRSHGPSKKALKRAKEELEKNSGKPASTLPIYSKEELEELERQEKEESQSKFDDDYDDYDDDDYYDDK